MKRPTHITGTTKRRKPDTMRQQFGSHDTGIVGSDGLPQSQTNQVSMDEDYSTIPTNNAFNVTIGNDTNTSVGNDTTTSALLEGHAAVTDTAVNYTSVRQ